MLDVKKHNRRGIARAYAGIGKHAHAVMMGAGLLSAGSLVGLWGWAGWHGEDFSLVVVPLVFSLIVAAHSAPGALRRSTRKNPTSAQGATAVAAGGRVFSGTKPGSLTPVGEVHVTEAGPEVATQESSRGSRTAARTS